MLFFAEGVRPESDAAVLMLEPQQFSGEALIPYLLRLGGWGYGGTVRILPNPTERNPSPFLPERLAGGLETGAMSLQLSGGQLIDLIVETPPSVLTDVVSGSQLLDASRLRRLEQEALSEGVDLGEMCLARGELAAESLPDLVVYHLQVRLGELLLAPFVRVEELRPPASPTGWGVAQYFQLAIPLESLLIGAARVRGLWQVARECFPSLKEVYGAKPSAFYLISQEAEYPAEAAILRALDGLKDLAEVAEATGEDPFESLAVFDGLLADGHVSATNPVELFQLGCEEERKGNVAKALRLFQCAEERGLDDFDLGFRLGELYHANGRDAEAIERFLAFAEKCVGQYRIEDTIRSCRKIIEIDPKNLEVLERYVSLLAKYGKGDEALHEGLRLARRFASQDEPTRALGTLEKIVELADGNEEVLRFYHELCEQTGHEQGAIRAQRRLAKLFHQRAERGKALEFYQGLFVRGEDTPEVRSRLCELHFAAGNLVKACEHLEHLKRMQGWSARGPEKEAVEFFRRLLESGVRESGVIAWLADEARHRGNPEETLRYLRLHCETLEGQGKMQEARRAAEQLLRLDPRNIGAARRLSALELRCGDAQRAAATLEQFAAGLKEDGNREQELRQVLQELLAINPLNLSGRSLLLGDGVKSTPSPDNSRLHLEVALLKLVSGECARGEALLGEFGEGSALQPTFDLMSGYLHLWKGDREQATLWFGKCGKLSAERGERHTLGVCIQLLKGIDPQRPELDALERAYTNLPDPSGAFQTRGHEVLQAKVAGITARLRDLKGLGDGASDAPGAELAAAGGTRAQPVARQASLKGVAALKQLRDGGGATSTATSRPPREEGSEPEAAAPKAQKSLSDTEIIRTRASAGAATEAPALAPPPKPKGSALKGVAALQHLRGQPSGAKAVAPSAEAETAPEEPAGETDAAAQRIAEAAEGTKLAAPKKVNTASSKLSALRTKPKRG